MRKFRLQSNRRFGHYALTYHKYDHGSFFTILGGWFFRESRQIGLIIMGFYIIMGQTMPIKSTPLTKEESEEADRLLELEDET